MKLAVFSFKKWGYAAYLQLKNGVNIFNFAEYAKSI